MKIRKIQISVAVQEKIFKKHGLKRAEIEAVFFDAPYYFKMRARYLAMGCIGKYITVVFEYNNKVAEIITAYQSSLWQKRLYKAKQWNK